MAIPRRRTPAPSIAPLQGKDGQLTREGETFMRTMLHTVALLNGELPTYANNAAAVSGGLEAGRWYVTSTGEVRIVV